MDDATADIIRRAMLEEASNTGPELTTSSGPSTVWRWPMRSVTDPAHLEDTCVRCGGTLGSRWLNTGYGPHHTTCWIERTTPGNREDA